MATIPVNFPIDGIVFAGRLATFCMVVMIGFFALVRRRVKAVPVELQFIYALVGKRFKPDAVLEDRGLNPNHVAKDEPYQMVVEDFKDAVPFSFVGRASVRATAKLHLTLDGKVRSETVVSPSSGDYRLFYKPRPEDVGTHNLVIKMEGVERPLTSMTVMVNVKGVSFLESSEHAR